MKNLALVLGLCTALTAAPASAQSTRDCDTFEANARNIYPPYEETIRHFANGDIRLIALDVGEPAAAAFHLMVTHPAGDEPFLACTLISSRGSLGYAGLWMDRVTAEYDASVGLVVTLPAQVLDGTDFRLVELSLTVNQAAGTVTASAVVTDTLEPLLAPAGTK